MRERFNAILVACFLCLAASSLAGEPGIEWQGSTELAKGGGQRGPWQQNESRYDYVDDPTVAIDPEGDLLVGWVDQRRKDVIFQRLSTAGERLDTPLNVSRSPATFSWLPRIAVPPHSQPGGEQPAFLLWQEIIFSGGSHGGDILFARSMDSGRSFSTPLNLSKSVGGDGKGRINQAVWHNGSLDVAAGRDGQVYAAWTEYDGPLWFAWSTNSGVSFSPPGVIAGGKGSDPARAPALAVAEDGTVYLAWTTGENVGADIRVTSSPSPGRQFAEPILVARTPNYSDAPKLAVGASGVLHMVYAESLGGPFEGHRIFYTHSGDGGKSFARARDISEPLPTGARAAGFPSLASDRQGSLVVSWELYERIGMRPQGLGYTVSVDGGRTFTRPDIVPGSRDGGSNGSHQGLLMRKVAVSETGAVLVVNSSLREGEGSRAWLMRGRITPQ